MKILARRCRGLEISRITNQIRRRVFLSFFSFRQDRTNIIIVVVPVGVVGNRGYAALAADGLKAVGSLAVNSF